MALQFSGGRDSLALLYSLQEFWPLLTVYYCNSGDAFPETLRLIDKLKNKIPNFVEIKGRVQKSREAYGWASDILPSNVTVPFGKDVYPNFTPMIGREACCFKSIMEPLHERMLEDGITLILRGQRDSDFPKSPVLDGTSIQGILLRYPIATMTTLEVDLFLGDRLPEYYTSMTSAPDCMHCTAWLETGSQKYLETRHPVVFAETQARLKKMVKILAPAFDRMEHGN